MLYLRRVPENDLSQNAANPLTCPCPNRLWHLCTELAFHDKIMTEELPNDDLFGNAMAAPVKGFGCRPFPDACLRSGLGPASECLQRRKPRVGRAPMPPSVGLPPLHFFRREAEPGGKTRPDLNALGSGTLAAITEAMSFPMPGTLSSNRTISF